MRRTDFAIAGVQRNSSRAVSVPSRHQTKARKHAGNVAARVLSAPGLAYYWNTLWGVFDVPLGRHI